MYKAWCEWDIGLDEVVFTSKTAAENHIRSIWKDCGFDDEYTYDDAVEESLIGFVKLEVIGE